MLRAQGLCVEIGGRTVVRDATFTVAARDKVGVVGRNGAGKTTLMKVLGGELEPHGGAVRATGAYGYLPQDPRIPGVFDARPAISHILTGRGVDAERERIEKLRVAMESDPSERNITRYTQAEESFRVSGGYAAESEARSIAAGLGLDDVRLTLAIGSMSGGERRRVELARILFAGSDVLCLDEPTNHLDVDARDWLLQFLRQYRGALIVISHDLELLDEAITRVLHLDRPDEEDEGSVVEYRGSYSQYQRARAADEERAAKEARTRQREIDRLQRVVDRFGAKATKAAMAHNVERRISRLESAQSDRSTRNDRALQLRLPDPPPSGRTVVEVSSLCMAYDTHHVFDDVAFSVGRSQRLLVLGLNGAGKTTLLRVLAGELSAVLGDVRFGHQVEVGYFAQEHDNLVPDTSVLDNQRSATGADDGTCRSVLGMFGLRGDKVHQPAGSLSGGERTKLSLAMLAGGRHNLLLLDEPTNNLDPSSRQAVADVLRDWAGTMILVSHDTWFVEQLEPTHVLVLPEGDVDHWGRDWLGVVGLS